MGEDSRVYDLTNRKSSGIISSFGEFSCALRRNGNERESWNQECTPPLEHAPITLRHLDYIISGITTGRNLERIADAVAEAVMTKLARNQRLDIDMQFLADAVLKRIEEERQIGRLATEIIRRGVDTEAELAEADGGEAGKEEKRGKAKPTGSSRKRDSSVKAKAQSRSRKKKS